MDELAPEERDDNLSPPTRLFERLGHIAGYKWDDSQGLLHSSYDNWQIIGTKNHSPAKATNSSATITTLSSLANGIESTPSSETESQTELQTELQTEPLPTSATTAPNPGKGKRRENVEVIAKVSTHALREERAFHICKSLIKTVDPEGEHIVRPLDIVHLQQQPSDKKPVIVCIFENPGQNYLGRVIDYGPAYYTFRKAGDKLEIQEEDDNPLEVVPLETFLDFAIGATECLEILHNGQRIVHGEIRGDAFHMNKKTSRVRLISFGSGLRTFEHGLTSYGWAALSKERGAKTKLCYMSPEQTGRMPAEPDSRTDIYSLGILFWTMLTQQAAFDGETPMDIIQGVLGRRLPPVSSVRMDVPDVISKIIQKMTAKTIGDRYHSASGLRYDLVELRTLLGEGNSAALKDWKIATRDVSSYFILPTIMVGRQREQEAVVKIIDKVTRQHMIEEHLGTTTTSSGSSLSDERLVLFNAAIGGSFDISGSGENDSAADFLMSNSLANSQGDKRDCRLYMATSSRPPLPISKSVHDSASSQGSAHSIANGADDIRLWESKQSQYLQHDPSENNKYIQDGVGGLNNKANPHKFHKRGRCEVVSISGAGGLGKSRLVHSVQVEARRRGYFASAKFDQAKKTAFGPVLKLLSSLFRQVFSETDTDTEFHQILKQYVRPGWPILHKLLDLPEFLFGPGVAPHTNNTNRRTKGYSKTLRAFERQDSSPASSTRGSLFNMKTGVQSSQDFLRSGSSTKSVRLMNTFLDVLRVFTKHKFICFCLDDLHFADEESLDMITRIIASRMKMVIIVTYRPDEILPDKIKGIIEPPNTEEYVKSGGVGVTRITLQPLTEADIVHFVAATLCIPAPEIIPLAAVIQSKTAGNPFFIREMLDTCHRKQCIFYDYRESCWKYDLDCIFQIFETKNYHDTLNSEFISTRISELPQASRAILAWASLIGTSFSFDLIQNLLSGEFDYDNSTNVSSAYLFHSQQDTVEGLQAAIQAYIIIATQQDDRFRFAHDRYMQVAAAMREDNGAKMHFIIAQTLMKYSPEEKFRDTIASHLCESVGVILERVPHRQFFRQMLFDCAQSAAENGARQTAAKFYAGCFALLQDSPWCDGEDVYYEDTLQLFTRAAECNLYIGNIREANQLLTAIFENARSAIDKAPAWVLQSRILAQEGDSPAAFQALKWCLSALDIIVDDSPSFQKCDTEFERLSLKIQSFDKEELINRNMLRGSNLSAVGAVLVETVNAAFWSDRLIFYQMSMVMVDTQLTLGGFPQAGMAFLHLGMIAISRFGMMKFASDMGDISLALMDRWQDNYTLGRGGTLYSLFLGHIQSPLQESIAQLQGALEYAIQAGDRTSTILNFGLVANLKFFASDFMNELEAFCTYGCEEIPDWELDTRGGTMIIAVRQVTRALQGKTYTSSAAEIMDDGNHSSFQYKAWLSSTMANCDRPIFFYEGLEVCVLFLYSHYQSAADMGEVNLPRIETVWSARNTRFLMFFQGLSLAAVMWGKLQNPVRSVHRLRPTRETRQAESILDGQLADVIKSISSFRKRIEDWQIISDVNYLSWSKLLAAQLAEMQLDYDAAMKNYEEALDHASVHNFVFEEALGNYLLAGFFLRRGSRRPAKAALREAIMLYRQFGAVGVAKHIEDEHSLLLQGPTRNLRTADVGAQTDFGGDSAEVQLQGDEDDARQQSRGPVNETKEERIGAWQGNSARTKAGSGLSALDMLDLTSILQGSQVISSVLQVDELLKTMCEIILQNCGGLASTVAIVVEEDEPVGWSIAASGDPEQGAQAHIPGIPLQETPLVAEGVIFYCTRFRETAFLPDLTHDERFSNVTKAWSQRNPTGKSVIAIPICHGSKPLLGVLYLEGQPNGFTDRNLTVLQLLVNQIGISYSNALTLKDIEKVSAFNNSMVDMQKNALRKALAAEKEANLARAEALRNVKLAEEAAKAKSIFLANVSHELRTPLNGVIGNSELLRDSSLQKDQIEMADSIRVSADLLLTVINDILDFSKMEADKMKLFIVAFNPDEMIREVIRSISYTNRDKRSSKSIDILQDIQLPQALIYGDPVRLHQVLGNLVSNSLKFTEKGTITIGAKTDWENEDSAKLTFWVKDTGIGIPSHTLVNLFKPFSQADASTARKYGGSGLGLSICRSLIESMMGGSIQLESTEGLGTTAWFSVTFSKADPEVSVGDTQSASAPMETIQLSKETAAPAASHADFSRIPRDQIRIAIAEDNPINQKIAIQFMEKLGFGVVDAYDNGLLAVEGLRRKAKEGKPYHIILMDVQMPVLDGYDATKLLRKDSDEAVGGTLVIAMTASAIQGDREKCLASGMNDYLAKPVRSGVLKKKLDQYLQPAPNLTPNLQKTAQKIANDVMAGANDEAALSGETLVSGSPAASPQLNSVLKRENTIRPPVIKKPEFPKTASSSPSPDSSRHPSPSYKLSRKMPSRTRVGYDGSSNPSNDGSV
ncbi:HHK1, histidine kinase-group X protein [Calycina marina]|uniref:histidine kinase n=1 Tax=Calycina marina TaxID=1763456 RepID=A0A9P7Z7C9_9HELO|nr:HHK1, histidine kinase-group X protein [Calycina marina]